MDRNLLGGLIAFGLLFGFIVVAFLWFALRTWLHKRGLVIQGPDTCEKCGSYLNYSEAEGEFKSDPGSLLVGSSTSQQLLRTCKACGFQWQVIRTTEYG